MAPYNYNWANFSQQPNGASYTYPNASSSTSNLHYGSDPVTSSYSSNSYPATANSGGEFGRQWPQQPTRSATAVESRAAETLSLLSGQEQSYPASYSSNSPAYSQTWNASQTAARLNADSSSTGTQHQSLHGANRAHASWGSNDRSPQTYAQGRQASYQQSSSPNNTYISTGAPHVQYSAHDPNSNASAAHAYSGQSHTGPDPARRASLLSPVLNGANMARARLHSVTPTAIQQQARNTPPQSNSKTSLGPSTIDPSEVYDPWPEQQRQAQKAAEERKAAGKLEAEKRAQQERKAEEERRALDEQAALATKKAQEERKRTVATERKKKIPQNRAKQRNAKQHGESGEAGPLFAATTEGNPSISLAASDMEAEMRALFEKMRRFNQADPALLARLWEEERSNHLASSNAEATQEPSTLTARNDPPSVPAASSGRASAKPKATSTSGKTQAATGKPRGRPAKARPEDAQRTKTAITSPIRSMTEARPAAPKTVAPAITRQATASAPVHAASKQLAAAASNWPPGRKQLISETGARWLNTRPENANLQITADRFSALLDGNPSYPDLCASIESMGLRMERSAFAKELLSAVPDLNKNTSTISTASPPPVQTQIASAISDTPATAQAFDPPQPDGTAQSPGGVSAVPAATGAITLPNNVNTVIKKEPLRPLVGSNGRPWTKMEASRKRGWDSLVDLTADDSDNEDIPSAKVLNIDHFSAIANFTPPPSLQSRPRHGHEGASTISDEQPNASLMQHEFSRDEELKGKVLVSGIRREKVARCNLYDPRTIARDILLATGRHPEMRSLNNHLMGMQFLLADHSEGVELHKYDLSTIRWDLIDPGNLPLESSDDSSDHGAEADDESDSSTAFARPTQWNDVPSADAATVVRAIAMPRSLKGMGSVGSKRSRGRPPGRRTIDGVRSSTADPRENGQNSRAALNAKALSGPASTTSAAPSGPPRPVRGSQATGQTSTASPGAGSPGPVGYAAFRNQIVTRDEHGNPQKRVGRPVGWRKAIHSKEAQGFGGPSSSASRKPANNSNSEVKRRGRPRLHPGTTTKHQHNTGAEYTVWPCGWEGCHAELHNLDTLRKHVVKIHGADVERVWLCKWRGCVGPVSIEGKGKATAVPEKLYQEFPTTAEWVKHVEAEHILQLARTLGDGPRGGLSDAYDSEASQQAYLSESTSGRIITPRATPLDDVHEENEAQSALLAPILRRGMPRVRGILSESQREDEQKLQQLEARKLSLGPGLERGGVRLATEDRRRGLYDDEDFDGEVSEDDGPE